MSRELMVREAELKRIQAARAELELKVFDLESDIKKVQESMEAQKTREAELTAQIEQLKE